MKKILIILLICSILSVGCLSEPVTGSIVKCNDYLQVYGLNEDSGTQYHVSLYNAEFDSIQNNVVTKDSYNHLKVGEFVSKWDILVSHSIKLESVNYTEVGMQDMCRVV